MATIETRIKCKKCGEQTAELTSLTRTEDPDSLYYAEGGSSYANDMLWVDYKCRKCNEEFTIKVKDL